MADAYIGEIRPFGFNFPPQDWASCTGTLISVNQNPTLYAVIGNQFGGTYGQTFKLPNLQGMVPMGSGAGPGLTPWNFASTTGANSATISSSNMPQHNHSVNVEAASKRAVPPGANPASQFLASAMLGASQPEFLYSKTVPTNNALAPNTLSSTGGVAPSGVPASHENRQPYLVINYCIAMEGYFPSRS